MESIMHFVYIVIACLATGFILMILIRDMKNTASFLTYHIQQGDDPIKYHPRSKMILFAVKTWIVIFINTVVSFKLFFVTMFLWVFLIYLMINFSKSWKAHGYSLVVLLIPTFASLGLGLALGSPILKGVAEIVKQLNIIMNT